MNAYGNHDGSKAHGCNDCIKAYASCYGVDVHGTYDVVSKRTEALMMSKEPGSHESVKSHGSCDGVKVHGICDGVKEHGLRDGVTEPLLRWCLNACKL